MCLFCWEYACGTDVYVKMHYVSKAAGISKIQPLPHQLQVGKVVGKEYWQSREKTMNYTLEKYRQIDKWKGERQSKTNAQA